MVTVFISNLSVYVATVSHTSSVLYSRLMRRQGTTNLLTVKILLPLKFYYVWTLLFVCSVLYVAALDRIYKTAELSQRRPRDAPNIWVPSKVLTVLTTHPATFPEICNGLLFRSILRMCAQKLKFVALPVPEIIGGTQKIWGVPGFAHAPYSPKFLKNFCLHGPCEYTRQVWSSSLYPFLR